MVTREEYDRVSSVCNGNEVYGGGDGSRDDWCQAMQ